MRRIVKITWWWILIGAGLAAGFFIGQKGYITTSEMMGQFQGKMDKLAAETRSLKTELSLQQTLFETEKVSNRELGLALQQAEDEIYELKKSLVFYQKVMSPELSVGGLAVDSFVLAPASSANVYRYRLVLTQMAKQRQVVSGSSILSVSGLKDDQALTLSAEQIAVDEKQTNLPFKFKYFQILEGTLKLPEGFVPEDVLVTLKVKGQRSPLTDKHSWQSAIGLADEFSE